MKNFEQLANQIVAVIKENGTGAITGDTLQDILLAMKDKMQLSCFEGVADTTTTPVTDYYGEHFYIATVAGTYSNFDDLVLDGHTVAMFYKLAGTTTWSHVILSDVLVETTVIQGSTNAVSGGAVYTQLATKANQSEFAVVQTKVATIEEGAQVNVPADWNQTDSSQDSYIKNKPTDLVHDSGYVHTDNNFTTELKDKLDNIEDGAEKNVQADWNASSPSDDAYIQNKPANLVQDASYVHTDNNYTTSEKNKLSGIQSGAEVNVQPDWNEGDSNNDAFIKNKPDLSVYALQTTMTAALAAINLELADKAASSIVPVICDAFAQMQARIDALTKLVEDATDRHNVYAHNVDVDSMSVNGMPMVLTASTTGAPDSSITPDNWDADMMGLWTGVTQFIGQIYVDTVSKKVYFAAKVTNSTADWVVLN